MVEEEEEGVFSHRNNIKRWSETLKEKKAFFEADAGLKGKKNTCIDSKVRHKIQR